MVVGCDRVLVFGPFVWWMDALKGGTTAWCTGTSLRAMEMQIFSVVLILWQPPIRQSYHYATRCTGSIVTGVKDFCFAGCYPFSAKMGGGGFS